MILVAKKRIFIFRQKIDLRSLGRSEKIIDDTMARDSLKLARSRQDEQKESGEWASSGKQQGVWEVCSKAKLMAILFGKHKKPRAAGRSSHKYMRTNANSEEGPIIFSHLQMITFVERKCVSFLIKRMRILQNFKNFKARVKKQGRKLKIFNRTMSGNFAMKNSINSWKTKKSRVDTRCHTS